MTSVPFCSLKYAHDQVKSDVEEAIEAVYRRGQFILGAEVEEFEREYANYSGTRYCVGLASGLDALYVSLHLLGIGKDDEVIVPAHTYIATWLAITRTGAKIIPVEVDTQTMLLDPQRIENAITQRTRAILPVHLYGSACDMSRLLEIAKRYELKIIEDNAQAHGAVWRNQRTGSFGHCNATSFYPTKNLGALGDGGAITTNDKIIYDQAIRLRNYGSSERFVNPVQGINSRLDELQAAVLRVKLLQLESWNEKRKEIAKIYSARLRGVGDIIIPIERQGAVDVFHLYVIQTQYREKLRSFLFQKGIGTMVHYPIPPHLQGAYRSLNFKKRDFPISECLSETVLSLPMWPGLGPDHVDWVIEQVKGFFSTNYKQ